MLIEIKGVQFVNKGAGLMLQAIQDRLQRRLPEAEVALTPGVNASFHSVALAGAWQRLRMPGAPFDVDALSYRLPARARTLGRRYGIVTESDVDAVLDASGFAYGSAWGDTALTDAAREIERLARSERHDAHVDAGLGLEDRQDVAEQARLLGRRRRGDGDAALLREARG
jgi:colanic acid/amylovoran biosynthesis protein